MKTGTKENVIDSGQPSREIWTTRSASANEIDVFVCLLETENDSDAFSNDDKVKLLEISIGDKVAALLMTLLCHLLSCRRKC